MAIEATVIENLIKEAFPDADVTVDGADGAVSYTHLTLPTNREV